MPLPGSPAPPPSIPLRNDHPIPKQHIVDGEIPVQTNKFYANFFLGGQNQPVWTHPYSLYWTKGRGNSYGMGISHIERSQLSFGPDANRPQYFLSPTFLQHVVLSAAELREGTVMTLDSLKAFSAYANFAPYAGAANIMSVPVVQGMGFITAIYNNSQPVLSSGVFFRSLKYAGPTNDAAVTFKYNVQLEDGSQWLIYITPLRAVGVPPLTLQGGGTITGPEAFSGLVQVTKNPGGSPTEHYFDDSAGAFATEAVVSGSVSGSTGKYTLSWKKTGVQSQSLLMYALPHHVESFDQATKNAITSIQLSTTTKGMAVAVLADSVTMIEDDLPTTIGFAPWAKAQDGYGGIGNVNVPPSAKDLINAAGTTELSEDMIAQTKLNSMYYSGKALSKYAGVVYTMQSIVGNSNLAAAGLEKLKDAFNVFVNNTQPEPLLYDNVWKGVVSGASYRSSTHDLGLDFGNAAYNDHHFHYGYFVHTAAVIGHLDPAWLQQGTNKQWVDMLVRDYANPVTDDHYPFSRNFDWFHGHSWAKGLFESADGKDQESTSEDSFATFALKMWGRTTGDANMEARGNLALAIQARSFNNYFLLKSDNKNQPPQFLFNKVTGILFENKVDHVTYFGNKAEYIEGIHMIPINPSSAYTRDKQFVTEEWNTYFSDGRADQADPSWRGILYANLALIDPQTSYNHFAQPDFDYHSLDGGASRTWYLAYTAALLNMGAAQPEYEVIASYPAQPQQCTAEQPASPTGYDTVPPSEPPTPASELQAAPEPVQQYQPQQPQPELAQGLPAPPLSESAPYRVDPSYKYNAATGDSSTSPDTSHPQSARPASSYSSWRSYFNKYRDNARSGGRNGRDRKPWGRPHREP